MPLRALESSPLALSALVYEARPLSASGGWSDFQSATAALGEGTAISLVKERMNASLPLRVLLVVLLAAVALFALRWTNRRARALYERYRLRLQTAYFSRLMGWLMWRSLLLLLAYAACAFALCQAFIIFIAPVYTFPEWVPAVLVEPADIQTAFWNVWQSAAAVLELRTPQLLRLRFLRELAFWAAIVMALGSRGLVHSRAAAPPRE